MYKVSTISKNYLILTNLKSFKLCMYVCMYVFSVLAVPKFCTSNKGMGSHRPWLSA